MKNDRGSVAPLYREFSTEPYAPKTYATTTRLFTSDPLFITPETKFQLSPLLNVNHSEITSIGVDSNS